MIIKQNYRYLQFVDSIAGRPENDTSAAQRGEETNGGGQSPVHYLNKTKTRARNEGFYTQNEGMTLRNICSLLFNIYHRSITGLVHHIESSGYRYRQSYI